MKNKQRFIQFEYGGHYSGYEWISKNPISGVMFKTSKIPYSALVEKICTKIAIDVTSRKVKLTYVLCESQRESTIVDDEDVEGYLQFVTKEGFRPVLHVELVNNVEECGRVEQMSRVEGKSSIGVNDVNDVNDEETIDANNGGVVTIFGGQIVEPIIEEANAASVEDCMENAVIEDMEHVDSRIDIEEDNGLDGIIEYYELPRAGEGIQKSQSIDEWEDGTGIELNQDFVSKEALQDLVNRAANKYCFATATVKSDHTRIMLRCRQSTTTGCKWYLRAFKRNSSDCFTVTVYRKMHTYKRSDVSSSNCKHTGTPRLIASVLHQFYAGELETPRPKSILSLVRGRIGLHCSYSSAWRGKKQHISDVRGSPEKSYTDLYSYLYMLKEVNPGTVTYVELDAQQRFKYLFIALGASIEGFKCMRKVIIMDATFLKTVFGGTLVFATAQDPNHHNYIIAFGVIDKENDRSWSWFLRKLKTIIPDEPGLVFMSDRHASIIKYVEQVFPNAIHGHCVWHLSQNVRGRVKSEKDEAATHFRACAHAYTHFEFTREYGSFRRRFPQAGLYLDKSAPLHYWARCYQQGEKYNIDTSNACESLNSTFKDARKYYLLPLLDAIVEKISEWFNKHRKESASYSESRGLVPAVENEIHVNCPIAKPMPVTELNSYERLYKVIGEGSVSYFVDLRKKTCSCRRFDIDKYPCVHAIAAAQNFVGSDWRTDSLDMEELSSDYYYMNTWALAYSRTIYPVPHASAWTIPDEIKELCVLPPEKTSKPGRNQENRFPSTGERRRKKTNNKFQHGIDINGWLQPEIPDPNHGQEEAQEEAQEENNE